MVLLATYFAMYSFIKCGIYRTIKQYSIMTFHALYTPIFWQGLRSTFRSISIINVNKNVGDITQSEQHLSAFCSYIASCIVVSMQLQYQLYILRFKDSLVALVLVRYARHFVSEHKKIILEKIEPIVLHFKKILLHLFNSIATLPLRIAFSLV